MSLCSTSWCSNLVRAATDAIAQTASDLKLGADYQARVRQTGRIPTDDDEFGTLKENAGLNAAVSLLAVLIILWLALRSARIIFAVAVSLLVGLAISAAWGLFLVGALNLISIAFFVLFIGLGVDFGIQFNVRYRAERHDYPELRTALHSTAVKIGGPLALAALATAVGFSSFLPTAYRGLSELGEIAGSGMIIAFVTSITLLPALLAVLNPPSEPHPMGFAQLAPVDRFLELHRIPVVVIIILVVVLASPLLFWLQFDFNPLHLQSPKVKSVATFLELRKDPQTGANAIEIEAPDLAAANATAQRLSALPQVSQTRTLSDLVPGDQDEKLKFIHDAETAIDASLNPQGSRSPAHRPGGYRSVVIGGRRPVEGRRQQPGTRRGCGAATLGAADAACGSRPIGPHASRNGGHRAPADLARSAQTGAQARAYHHREYSLRRRRRVGDHDGHARVQVLPKGDPEDTEVLRGFATSVLAVEPNPTRTRRVPVRSPQHRRASLHRSWIFRPLGDRHSVVDRIASIGDMVLTPCCRFSSPASLHWNYRAVFDLPLILPTSSRCRCLLGVGVAFKSIISWRGRPGKPPAPIQPDPA